MSFVELLRGVLRHTLFAGSLLCLLLGAAEFFVPGSVLPFFDLIHFGLAMFVLAGVGILWDAKTPRGMSQGVRN